ncbi:MCE family protein [Oxynema sp. CENA135]|uniref:MlaD family protein n=1 Tax=Oxynema sp. CENA135 TaxID=984206 RepID=UPI00190C7905|nr:MlaD family protein [Oxynema sp. CENA135]MBK4732870.1 MCE family protein [Oxynema sp. CENA135]
MRSRTLREGSVGLLILGALGLFGGIVLWLKGVTLGPQSYRILVEFANVVGMQEGASVRYRGVKVGRISSIQPGTNGVEVELTISPPDLVMPSEVLIEANQGGLIGETVVDITPLKPVPTRSANAPKPLDAQCNSDEIVCARDRLKGQIGVSFDELVRGSIRFTRLFSDPAFFNNLNSLVQNTTAASAEVTQLTRQINVLSQSVQKELTAVSSSTNQSALAIATAARQIGNAAGEFGSIADEIGTSVGEIGGAARQFGAIADDIGTSANRLNLTTVEVYRLVSNVNSLVASNRGTLVSTLNNLNQTSEQVRQTIAAIAPTLANVEGQIGGGNFGTLFDNLNTLANNAAEVSANAAEASAALREFSSAVGTPTNLLLLQQTLDSARATFQNAQKITSDLDELTGDPTLRENIRNLIESLSDLLSSTQHLEQQTLLAQSLGTLSSTVHSATAHDPSALPSVSVEAIEPSASQSP